MNNYSKKKQMQQQAAMQMSSSSSNNNNNNNSTTATISSQQKSPTNATTTTKSPTNRSTAANSTAATSFNSSLNQSRDARVSNPWQNKIEAFKQQSIEQQYHQQIQQKSQTNSTVTSPKIKANNTPTTFNNDPRFNKSNDNNSTTSPITHQVIVSPVKHVITNDDEALLDELIAEVA